MKDIRTELIEIFRKVLKNEKLKLEDKFTDKDVEGWDSMAQVELISEIEQNFDIDFTLKDIPRISSFGSIIQLIQEKTGSSH
jgi:acyl carrier protein